MKLDTKPKILCNLTLPRFIIDWWVRILQRIVEHHFLRKNKANGSDAVVWATRMGLALNEWFRMKVKRKRWLAALATRAHLSFNVVGSYGWARWPVRVPVGVVLIVEWKLDDPVLDLASGPNWHRNQHPNWSTCHGCHFFSPPLPTSCDVESVWWKRLETPRRTRLPTPSTPSPQIGAIQLARWFFCCQKSVKPSDGRLLLGEGQNLIQDQ